MTTKSLTYRIGADIGDLRRKMEDSNTLTRQAQRELARLEAQQRQHRATLTDLGQGFTMFGAGVAIALALSGKAAIEWESAFTGVRKTVDGSDAEIAALEGELRNLARTLPSTHKEIAAVAEAAGQLGIKRKDIAEFTKVMIDLGETTNLTAEDAAAELAKFANIMGTSASDVDRLGSALVALGNDGASTEADILSMALRLAGAGKQIKLTEGEVLGFASALSSVGIEAEAGGSSMSTVMIKIAAAVQEGGDAVTDFAQVAGMSAKEFSARFKDDAGAAIIAFIQGLGKMQQTGGDVFGTLDDLGLGGILVRDALLRASSASDMFTKSLRVGNSAWAENKALTEEAEKRYQTTESQMKITANQIKDSMIDIGAAILPVIKGAVDVVRDLVTWWQNLPGPVRDVLTVMGLAAAGITLVGGVALIAVPKILAFRESMRALSATGGGMSGALGKFGLFMSGPWAAAIGVGVTLLAAFGIESGGAQRRQDELAEAGKSVASAIKEQNGAINESVRRAAAKEAADKGLLSRARELGLELGVVTDAILEQGNSYSGLKARLEEIMRTQVDIDTSTGTTIESLNAQGKSAKELIEGLDGLINGKKSELQTQKDVAAATKDATGTQKEQAKSTEDLKTNAEEATKAFDDLVKALNSLNDTTLSAREAHRSYLQQLVDTAAALRENGKTLDINTEKGRANLEALDAQAGAANKLAEAAAREAQQTGGAAAGAAALKASLEASRPELIKTAQQFGMNEQQAKDYADQVLAIPGAASTAIFTPGAREAQAQLELVRAKVMAVPPGKTINVGVLDAQAITQLEALGIKVRELPDGTVEVTAPTDKARQELDRFINQQRSLTITAKVTTPKGLQLKAPGGGMVSFAHGGIVSYASGGIEDHRPQIARGMPGMVRVWAEKETDRESYIPWAMDRRIAATDVLRQTADGFGYALVPKSRMVAFANGGINGGVASGRGGGIVIEQLVVQAYSDQFRLSQVMQDLAYAGVH